MQRDDFLTGKVSFEDYYRTIYKEAGINFAEQCSYLVPKLIKNKGELPLGVWDGLALSFRAPLERALQQHKDFFSLASGVCAIKQAAKDALEHKKNEGLS